MLLSGKVVPFMVKIHFYHTISKTLTKPSVKKVGKQKNNNRQSVLQEGEINVIKKFIYNSYSCKAHHIFLKKTLSYLFSYEISDKFFAISILFHHEITIKVLLQFFVIYHKISDKKFAISILS